ncbi:MAG: histidinol dehydrogenase [Candidatus Dormibacteria bacterium]
MSSIRTLDAAAWRAQSALSHRRFTVPVADPATAQRLHSIFGHAISATEAVRAIVDDVRERGDAAVHDWTVRIDGVHGAPRRIDAGWMRGCREALDPGVGAALARAAERIRLVHSQQRDAGDRGEADAFVRPQPLQRVGCYVPGGRAAYPSTVLMSVVPAQVAGVESIALSSPAGPDGNVHPLVAAAADLLGVAEVWAVGGAQAIAMLAYGTATVDPVDKVVGPGNLFVTLAKREVVGAVDIDQLAGPSEIVVVASAGARPREVAADLVSQLEHDPLAWAVCITDSPELAAAVAGDFEEESSRAERSGVIAESAGRHGAVVLVRDIEDALSLVADFAPEHLSLQGDAAEDLRDRFRNAGAVFCGRFAPVSIGDYIAGPNHTLPTQGAARYRGPLSVMDFVRWPSLVTFAAADFAALADAACTLARAEGLTGHERALRLRMEED